MINTYTNDNMGVILENSILLFYTVRYITDCQPLVFVKTICCSDTKCLFDSMLEKPIFLVNNGIQVPVNLVAVCPSMEGNC